MPTLIGAAIGTVLLLGMVAIAVLMEAVAERIVGRLSR